IRTKLPPATGSHTERLFYERRTRRPGGFSARCPPSCYFGSPESDFHFDGYPRISMGTSRAERNVAPRFPANKTHERVIRSLPIHRDRATASKSDT
ncbi:hypothetical protein X777_14613, partial [Ooceraea biroi]